MKFFVVLLFVQLLTIHLTWSALSRLEDSRNPDHPGKCYVEGNPPTILSPGETVTIKGECRRASCTADFSVDFATCGIAVGPKEHYIPENHSLPYPDCCAHYEPLTHK